MRMAAADAAVGPASERQQDGPAQAFDIAQAQLVFRNFRYRRQDLAGGHRLDDALDEPQRLERFVEADGNARGDVARRGAHLADGERIVRCDRKIAAQVARLATGAARHPRQAELHGQRGRYDAARTEAILQARMLVVDVAHDPDLTLQRRAFVADTGGVFGRNVARDAPRHHVVHQQPMAEGDEVRAQHVLLQPRKLREAERESAVVAEVAQIAEVIGEALTLERQRAQPSGAHRDRQLRDRLHRLRVRPRVSHRAVAGDASGETISVEDSERLEALFDALVRIPQPLPEPQDFFPYDR